MRHRRRNRRAVILEPWARLLRKAESTTSTPETHQVCNVVTDRKGQQTRPGAILAMVEWKGMSITSIY